MTLYADDPDVHVRYTVTDTQDGGTNDFTPIVHADSTLVDAAWEGAPSTGRVLRVNLDGLEPGNHTLRLIVPDDNDVLLGTEYLH